MQLLYALAELRTPFLDALLGALTNCGGELVFMAAAIIVFWCVSKSCGYYMLTVGFVGTIVNQFLKLVFRIPRPWVKDPDFQIVESARAEATGYSFPSGHTQNVFASFGCLGRWTKRTWLRAVCALLIVVTAFSRMYLGVHTPLDVGVSFGIGLVLVFALYLIFNTLLQVLDDGHLTDGQGRKVDFKNTIIILTTNLGTRDIAKAANTGFNLGSNAESSYQRMKDQVSSELKQQFRPEFLNRLDDIIVFRQLTEPQVRQIVDLDIKQLNDRLFDRHMSLELTPAAKDLLAQKGFDPLLGARPLRRVIQRDIEDAISEKILMGDLEDGQRVIVDAEGEGILGEFTFKGEEFEEPAAADKPAEDGAATDGETPADATPATEPAESAPADSGDAPQE